jgi:hypothetical protein
MICTSVPDPGWKGAESVTWDRTWSKNASRSIPRLADGPAPANRACLLSKLRVPSIQANCPNLGNIAGHVHSFPKQPSRPVTSVHDAGIYEATGVT